jgi:hypothetical protein
MWSETIHKKNPVSLGVGRDALRGEQFITMFSQALAFRRKNREGLRRCYAPDTSEAERKYDAKMHADMPQYVKNGSAYAVTNICDSSAKEKVLQTRNRNGGTKQNSRHRDGCDDDADDETNTDRDVAPGLGRKRHPLTAAYPPASGWTLAALNKEKFEDLRDICLSQHLVVSPSHGKRCVKADYVAAILDAQDSSNDQSDAQLYDTNDSHADACGDDACEDASSILVDSTPAQVSSGMSSVANCEELPSLPCASNSPAIGAHPPDGELIAPVHSVQSCSALVERELLSELDSFLSDCAKDNINPFEWDGKGVNSRELALFDRDMSANAEGSELSHPEPEQEEAVIGTMTTPIESLDVLKARRTGVWKRKYAEALAASLEWKPSKIVDTKSSRRGRNLRNKGAPLRSVTLSRVDGNQFTVAATGCVFYLLNTPGGVELVKIC